MAKQSKTEQKINELLTGDAQKNALDFLVSLRKNGLSERGIVIAVVGDGGDFPHIRPWTIFFNSCDFTGGESIEDDLKEFAWKHVHICDHFYTDGKRCGCSNQPGLSKMIFGKEFDNLCKCPLIFINPDAKTLKNVIKLMLMFK